MICLSSMHASDVYKCYLKENENWLDFAEILIYPVMKRGVLSKLIRAYIAKHYWNLKATNAQIMVLFLYWLPTVSNSQTAEQMKEFHLKYEITLERLEIFTTKYYLQFCLVNPYIFTQLFTCSFSRCVQLIVRQAFKYIPPIYIKRLIRPQILWDCILAPKQYSNTKSYLLKV